MSQYGSQYGGGRDPRWEQRPIPGHEYIDRLYGSPGPGSQPPASQFEPGGGPGYGGGGEGPYGPAGGGQGYGGGGYGYPTGGYGTGGYGAGGSQQEYGRDFGNEDYGNAGQWGTMSGWGPAGYVGPSGGQSGASGGEARGGGFGSGGYEGGRRQPGHQGFGGSTYGQPGSYGARDEGGRQGWGAGGYRDEGMGLSIQGYGSTGYGTGGREANATWGMGGTQEARPQYRPQPGQRFGEVRERPPEPPRRQWRAPQGYQRPDQRIYEDVCDRLAEHPYVDPRSVCVKVENGIVTLEGIVATRQEKHMAEDLADSIPGVKDVENHLRVGPLPHAENKEDVVERPEGGHTINQDEPGYPSGEAGSVTSTNESNRAGGLEPQGMAGGAGKAGGGTGRADVL